MRKGLNKIVILTVVLFSLSGCNQIKTVSALEGPETQVVQAPLQAIEFTTQDSDEPVELKEVEIEPVKRVEIVWEIVEQNDIKTEYINDDTLLEGEEVLKQSGQMGIMKIAYELSYQDDKLISKQETGETEIVQELKHEIIHVGTKTVEGNFHRNLSMQILEETNQYRNENSQHALQWDEQLYTYAKIRAKEISKVFSHTRPDGQSWDSVNELVMGENLARGYHSAQTVVDAWIASNGHKENLLRDYATIAIASYEDESGHMFIVQLFGY